MNIKSILKDSISIIPAKSLKSKVNKLGLTIGHELELDIAGNKMAVLKDSEGRHLDVLHGILLKRTVGRGKTKIQAIADLYKQVKDREVASLLNYEESGKKYYI